MRPSRAFTIIEMVIVLTAMGLIVGVTAPRFVGNGARAQARAAARGLTDALTAQRAEAIRSMAPARLYLVGGSGSSSSGGSGGGSGGAASIRLVESADTDSTGEALAAMLIERGRVEAPFRLLGAWSGVTLGSADRADDPPGGWRHVTIRIEPTGRASLDEGQTGIPLVAPRHGDTIWRIEFDPISGVPAVRAP